MIKCKGNNMGKAKCMGVISQGKEKIRKKNVWRTMQNMKMSEHKQKPCKGVNLMHAHGWTDDWQDWQISQREWWLKNKRSWRA